MNVGELEAVLRLDTDQFDRAINSVPGRAKAASAGISTAMGTAEAATAKTGAAAAKTEAAYRGTAQAVDKAADSHERASKKVGDAGKAFAAVSAVVAGSVVARFVGDSIKAASDLNETVSKSGQIFGDSARKVEQFGNTAAEKVGLSKAAAMEAASNFGNMFTQLGYTSDAAADLSTKVVQMSGDLGSFNNMPTADVADRISAAFRGEYDSLQLLIPNISAARVESEAMAMAGVENADSLTAQQKAAAVLAIVNRDGARAMGDYSRTADGFANSTKTLTARIENQKAELGEKLLPVASTVLALFSDVGVPALSAFGEVLGVVATAIKPVVELLGFVLSGFTALPAPLQTAIVAFGIMAALRGPISHLGDGVSSLTGKVKGLGAVLKANPIGLIVTGIATAFSLFSGGADKAKAAAEDLATKVDSVTDTLDEQTGAVTENTRAWIRNDLGPRLDDFRKLGVTTQQVTDAMLGEADAAKEVYDAIQRSAEGAVEASGVYAGMKGRLADVGVGMHDLAAAALNQDWSSINAAIRDYNANLEAGQQPIAFATAEFQQLEGAVGGIRQNYHDLNGITGIVTDAQGDLAAAVADSGGVLRNAKGPVNELAGVYDDGKVAADELEKQIRSLMLVLDEKAGRDGDAAAQQRFINGEIREYFDAIAGVPAAERAIADARDAVAEAQEKLNKATGPDKAAASRELADAQASLADAQLGAGAAADKQAEAQERMREVMVEAGQKAFNYAISQGDVAGASGAAEAAMNKVRDSFIAMQPEADIASGKAADVARELGLIPEDVTPTINANAEGAKATIGEVQTLLTTLDGRAVTVEVYAQMKAQRLAGISDSFLAGLGPQEFRAAGGFTEWGRSVHAAAGLIRQSAMFPGGANAVHFAEASIPWESYISGDPRVSGRSHALMDATAARLGGKYLQPGVALPTAAPDPSLGSLAEVLGRVADAIASSKGKIQLGEHVVVNGVDDLEAKFYELSKLVG